MIANIFEFSLFLKNVKNWLIMVQNGQLVCKNTQNMGMAKLVQTNLSTYSDI